MSNSSLKQDNNFNIHDAYEDLIMLLKTTLIDICNGIITGNISIQKHNKNKPVTVNEASTLLVQLNGIIDLHYHEITEINHKNNILIFKEANETITTCPIENINFSVIYADNKDKKQPFCLYEAYEEINKLICYILSDFYNEKSQIKISYNSKKNLNETQIYDMKEYLDLTLYASFDDNEDYIRSVDYNRRHNMGLTFLKEIICAYFGDNSSLYIKGEK